MAELSLSLLCPPSLDERLLDELLDVMADAVFTSSLAFSHGLAHAKLGLEEQVLGRSASAHFQVLVDEDDLQPLLSRLQEAFKGTGLRYWATPVALDGEI